GRLFSADVANPAASGGQQTQPSGRSGMSSLSAVMYGRGGPTNLSDAIEFFRTNGLMGELEGIIEAQLARQPHNALLRAAAVGLYREALARPERALDLLAQLETMEFPLEFQAWLGTCSQRDYFRMMRYGLIGSKPALRDARLTALNGRDDLSRDETLELAMIRQSQGNIDESISLLAEAVAADDGDSMALSALTDALVRAERFAEAEPHARRLIEVMQVEHERLQEE